jgi:hypothetical protein
MSDWPGQLSYDEINARQIAERKAALLAEVDWNEGYVNEGLDRCHTIQVMIEELLVDHPTVLKSKSWDELQRASDLINDVYQQIGELDE